MNLHRVLPCALLAISVPVMAAAGTLITIQEETLGRTSTSKLYLQSRNLRIEPGGQEQSMIYRSDSGSFWMLDPRDKTYRDLGSTLYPEDVMAAERKGVLNSRSLVDPEKILDNRDSMYGTGVGQSLGGVPTIEAPTTFLKVASGVKVNGYLTDEYELTQGGEKVGEVWLGAPKNLNVDPADIAAFRWLRNRMPRAMHTGAVLDWSENAPEGMPVRTVTYEDGRKVSTVDITSVSHKDIPSSMFELPKDFKPAASHATRR